MCLAAAYKNQPEADSLVCKSVSNIKVDGNKVILTDIMGEEIEIEGIVSTIDLVKNVVVIQSV